MNIEKQFPAKYAKSNVDIIVSSIGNVHFSKPCNSINILAPSGFGKTSILKYITYNKKYQRRYKNLKRIEFIYLDIHEVLIEKATGNASRMWTQDYSPHTIALQEILYRKFVHKVQEMRKQTRRNEDVTENWSRDKLINIIEDLIKSYPRKRFYLILDNIGELLSENTLSISNLLEYIRDKFKGNVEFIFSTSSSKWFSKLNTPTHGKIADYLTHQIVILKLMHAAEIEIYSSNLISRLVGALEKNTSKKQAVLKKIDALTGGYLPYKKYLVNLDKFPNRVELNPTLISISERLLNSLTPTQKGLMQNIAIGNPVENTWDLEFLKKSGLVLIQDKKLRLFSPIMWKYLTSRKPNNN